jgi:hypothetical protein
MLRPRTPLFHLNPYELTPYGQQVFAARLEALEEKRRNIMQQIRKVTDERTPVSIDLATGLGLLQQVTSDIEYIEQILGQSDGRNARHLAERRRPSHP